ncbi:MAG: neutral/alkaline non-lysosomal ceramidase N-terminal domain-containing protein [Theionarchaea archaeon]|nr:neutral/alkaline non-lysosomal ceramidase N-terminal domain-containing protein [Theionarchaea archaeon]
MKKTLSHLMGILINHTGTPVGGTPILAGASKIDITPRTRAYIAGYGQNRLSSGVHDPIWARCLVLEVAGKRMVFLTVDLIGLFLDEVDAIRKAAASEELSPEDIIICSTHNHEGPDTLGLWGPNMGQSGVDYNYRLYVSEKAVKCVKEAEDSLRPARLRVGQTMVEGVAKNGRDRDILDPVLIAIQAVGDDGTTIATLVNFANHPEALGSKNTLISADWPNYMYVIVEKVLGGICVFQNGALGGMVTPDVRSHTFEETERIGTTTGKSAIKCLEDVPFMECENMTHVHTIIRIPVANRNFLAMRKAGIIRREFQGDEVETELHLIRLGDVDMVTLPGEALPKVGLAIKELMRAKNKLLIGLGNDELGYIIPEEDFDPSKYEESMSVGPKVAPLIEAGIAGLYGEKRD